ncbi:TonB-dependent receptor [Flagellimonas sp. 389]|uniref:SusC/RagA family TonB-linked outer membrane protein n=1 Tax=Flagellimonas sp. 389 TaxID=2835862 RepID=UPI001BD6D482|nr:TonB-dependent receptor [Flagellimonas sp. 389]MBS9462582.1 TonB-dependent receptor [Flagellimonas sp. 389]
MMKMLLKKETIAFCILFCGLSTIMYSQQITGTVTDPGGVPLSGATIIEKGTTNGVQADFDGNYTIIPSNDNAILVFSYIGFSNKEENVSGRTTINVTLQEDVSKLDEVVVIGYGTQRRQNVSAAISTVDSEALEGRPVADFQSALQGQVAGLQITSNSGRPGAGNNIQIRGAGTITGNSSPLYVIDGAIVENGIGGGGDPFATINPADIASINVLKDASAAAIYGARAANGVIIVTTKKGKPGKASINFNTFSGFQNVTNKLDLLDSQQYQEAYNTARDNAGQARIPNLDGTTITTNTDWQDAILRTGIIQNYELSASGGNEKTRYYTSVAHYDEEGIVLNTGLERTTLRFNSTTELGKFTFGNSITYSRSVFDREYSGNGFNVLNWAIRNPPTVEVFNPETVGGFGGPVEDDGNDRILNPVAAQSLITNQSTVNRLLGNIYGAYKVLDGLEFKISVSADLNTFKNREYSPFFNQIPGAGVGSVVTLDDGAFVEERRGDGNSFIVENTLNYRKDFNKHTVDALIGFTTQERTNSFMEARNVGGAISDGFPVLTASVDDNLGAATGTISEVRTVSYIGRMIYDYDDRYLATANFRRDGSSVFSAGNYFDNFFSGSVGWVVSNEKFLRNSEAISNLKIRASYGFLGNDRINANAARSTLQNNIRYILGINGEEVLGTARAGRVGNSALQWEKQEQLNIGLDAAFAKNKLTLTADYFVKSSIDLLLNFDLPETTGFNNIIINSGEVENRGLELAIGYRDQFGDFSFGFSANATFLDNEVTQLTDGLDFIGRNSSNLYGNQPRNRVEVGRPISSFFGYRVEGIYQSQEEIDNGPTPIAAAQPGDLRFSDVSGPDGVPDGIINEDDQTFIGDATQDLQYGFSLNLGYKGFDLSAQFQGVAGNDIWNDTKFNTDTYFLSGNLSTRVLNAWTPENPSNTVPRATTDATFFAQPSSFYVEDGSYLRLKNLQVGYSFSVGTLDQIGVGLTNARIYFAGQNIFTITNYSGYDPEIGITNPNNSNALGFDNVSYPQARTLTVGLQLGF